VVWVRQDIEINLNGSGRLFGSDWPVRSIVFLMSLPNDFSI